MPTHSGKSFALGTQGNPGQFPFGAGRLNSHLLSKQRMYSQTPTLFWFVYRKSVKYWNGTDAYGFSSTCPGLFIFLLLSLRFHPAAIKLSDIYNLILRLLRLIIKTNIFQREGAQKCNCKMLEISKVGAHRSQSIFENSQKERRREKRGGACRSDCLCLLVSQALEITSKGIAALKRTQIELQCGSWRSLAGGACSDGVILSHKGRLGPFSKEATSSPLSSRQNRWNDSCKSHLWPTKTPCPETMYMQLRSKGGDIMKPQPQASQDLLKVFKTGCAHWWLFKDSLLL